MIGRATADYLARHLGENRARALGIGWGATLRETVRHLASANLRDLSINSMMGGLTYGSELNTFEIASQFARRVKLPWAALLPAAAAALIGSFSGAWTVTLVSAEGLRKALPLVLVGVLAYTLARKDLGRSHTPHLSGHAQTLVACAIGAVLGFYDGFFGPGAGSFFVFAFVRLLGFDFLNASASAKLMNTATNIAALLLFAAKGHVWWHIALVMALANIAGSLIGTRLALKHGAGFVRVVFIAVVAALILKTGYDAFIRTA